MKTSKMKTLQTTYTSHHKICKIWLTTSLENCCIQGVFSMLDKPKVGIKLYKSIFPFQDLFFVSLLFVAVVNLYFFNSKFLFLL